MFFRCWHMTLALVFLVSGGPALAQGDPLIQEIEKLAWQESPAVGAIGSVARVTLAKSLRVADDMRFLNADGTRRFLELNGNPPRDNNYVLAPRSLDWFSVFTFDASGYVRDDEQLDADELLSTLKEQNQEGAAERRRLNLPVLKLVGWAVPPHYDTQTRRLEWGTRLVAEGEGNRVTVNYTIRLLGRSGVMSAVLVSDPTSLEADIQQFRTALQGFDFVAGQRYAEYRQGDHVAEYGLAALIVGGAAAAAAKAGFFKTFGKLLIYGGAALVALLGGFVRKLFKRQG